MMGGGMMGGGMMGAMGIWAILVILVLLAVLVVAVLASIWLIRKLTEDAHSPIASGDESAYETLRHRYAAGEIDDNEYEYRLATLDRR
jgi:putative membrane protein